MGGDFLRVMEKFNYNRIMNQAGFAQIPDLAGIMGAPGWKGNAFPDARNAPRRGRGLANWSLQNGLARDLEEGIAGWLGPCSRATTTYAWTT